MDNFRQRFFFPDTDIRGEFLRLESALTPVLSARDYPLEIQDVLAEALVAAALMTGTLKFDGRLSLQAKGTGELTLMLAEATHDNKLRGLAQWQQPVAQGSLPSLGEMLGDNAMLVITLEPDVGQRYQSVVPLEQSRLQDCLADYFLQSEQLPTQFWLACGGGRAAGLLLQRMPAQQVDADTNRAQWNTLTALANTLSPEELLSLSTDTLLHRLFHETPPRVTEAVPLQFGCSCTRTRVENMLLSLGEAALQEMLDEQGEADISCDFCRQNQHFSGMDLQGLLRRAGH